MIYSIWEGEEYGITLKPGPGRPREGRDGLDMDAILVKAFKARTWIEAIQIEHDHYGWGQYITMEGYEDDQSTGYS